MIREGSFEGEQLSVAVDGITVVEVAQDRGTGLRRSSAEPRRRLRLELDWFVSPEGLWFEASDVGAEIGRVCKAQRTEPKDGQ